MTNLLGRGIAVKTIKSILDITSRYYYIKESTAEKMAKCVTVKGVAEKHADHLSKIFPKY